MDCFWFDVIPALILLIVFTGIIVLVLRGCSQYRISIEVMFGRQVLSLNTKKLIFKLKNLGFISQDLQAVHCFIYFETLTFFEVEAVNAVNAVHVVSTDRGPFYCVEIFNDNPCHSGTKIELCKIDVEMARPFPYDWINQSPIYIDIYTSRGRWVPIFFSKFRENPLTHNGDLIGYQINNLVV
jgi:hypothetical protein